MRYKDIVSVSGLSGLFKIEGHKASGFIVTSLTEGWTKFISNREHFISPLENISIYTSDENVDLLDVLLEVHKQRDTNPPLDAKADNEKIKDWFEKILPSYDREKVHVSDVKKLIKWFHILDEKGVIQTEIEEKEKQVATGEQPSENNHTVNDESNVTGKIE